MQHFLKAFLDIVLWRRGPQDLPSSRLLVLATLFAYLFMSIVQLAIMRETRAAYLVYLVLDPLLLCGWIWLVLKLHGRPERYAQTIAAVLGTSALLALLVSVPIELLFGVRSGAEIPAIAQLLSLGTVIVFLLVAGRIIKLATDSNLFTGIAVAATYVVLLIAVASGLAGSGA